MVEVDRQIIQNYRRKTFRSEPADRIHNQQEAVRFVNQRGFISFWPISGIPLPSLWVAAAGDRPVADEHDDPGHITWGWKDDLLGKGVWFYGRVLARKNCMISLEKLPYFYALSPNYGEPEVDYLEDYHRGSLPLEAKNVYETLLWNGPLDSITLRRAAHLSTSGTESRFNRALEILQTSFRLVPVGISTNGAWHYSFVYDLFHRHFPQAIEKSRLISEKQARAHLLQLFFESVGACTVRDITRVFRWDLDSIEETITMLIDSRCIIRDVQLAGDKQPVICLSELL